MAYWKIVGCIFLSFCLAQTTHSNVLESAPEFLHEGIGCKGALIQRNGNESSEPKYIEFDLINVYDNHFAIEGIVGDVGATVIFEDGAVVLNLLSPKAHFSNRASFHQEKNGETAQSWVVTLGELSENHYKQVAIRCYLKAN